jgi:hypothetical protein
MHLENSASRPLKYLSWASLVLAMLLNILLPPRNRL